jgi:hypothetical protein
LKSITRRTRKFRNSVKAKNAPLGAFFVCG